MSKNKLVICVTGKIGTGKSTVSNFFRNKGFKYINMDEIGKIAFDAKINEIVKTFGTTDRNKLRQIVFENVNMLKKLEAILHPEMIEILNSKIKDDTFYVIEAAIKKRLNLKCDFTITVTCKRETIYERVLKRGLSKKEIDNILNNQTDITNEGIIISNDSTLEKLYSNLEKIYNFILKSIPTS